MLGDSQGTDTSLLENVLTDAIDEDKAAAALQRALELGYRDFRYMREDRDLDTIRHDPRFRQLLREYENR